MIKHKLILLILGALLIIESFFMGIATAVSGYYAEYDFIYLVLTTGITLLVGLILVLLFRKTDKKVEKREAYLIVTFSWILLSFFGSLPFYISGAIPVYADAFFETISGFTTTGASILNNIEEIPHGLLLWRSTTQWMGGMGIIVLTIAITPLIKVGGMQLFSAEAPGIATDKLHPRIAGTAKKLWLLYFGFTSAEAVLLYVGGMSVFDAVNHAFTTMATGGYSTKQASIAAFDSPFIQYVIIFFMMLAGTNFALSYFAITGQFKKVFKNSELKFYFIIILLSGLIIAFGLWHFMGMQIEPAIRHSLFQVVSIITTTGYATLDYLTWVPGGFWVFILMLMFVGGSSGSTAGGIKVVRIHILFRNSYMEFKRLIHPHAVLPVRYNKSSLPQNTINNVLAFIILYIMIIATGTLIMSFTGLDLETSFGAVATSLGNIGPGIGDAGPASNFANISVFGKWFLGLLMLMGRLELFTVLIIFTRYFWKR
ncbi:MAG: potassium transporter TrkG [Bacteroidales bacterium]|nr:potassium transporter TrkG [Bacteroidales bacterium]MDD4216484.1 potassium transporter TrkG [Bacteroidales bacterium]MDY0141485.1 potassium transporter TrkG [Bacteroidales bacterium]